jgi:hypothetical protein
LLENGIFQLLEYLEIRGYLIGEILMEFIHAIDLDNFYTCHNLSIDGKLRTPNFLALIDAGISETHKTIDSISIEDLKIYGPQECGVVTPRTCDAILIAAMLRSGQKMVNGFGEETLVSDDRRKFLLKSSEVELAFERVRRSISPQSVSRLSCIWLAERTPEGEQHIKVMLGPKVCVLKVRITSALNFSRTDTAWFDQYWQEDKPEYVARYWSGVPQSETPKWEYLLDGEIEVEDQQQLEIVKNFVNINQRKYPFL